MSASAILKLQEAGFSAKQVTAIAELIDSQSATKADVEGAEHRLDLKISEARAASELRAAGLEGKITLLQWMMGFALAFQVAFAFKLFGH
jgi:hypothetical protein